MAGGGNVGFHFGAQAFKGQVGIVREGGSDTVLLGGSFVASGVMFLVMARILFM